MFNRRLGDDQAAAREIAQIAIAEMRVPGLRLSRGNASGAVDVVSNAVPGGATPSGTATDGTSYFVCLTQIDSTNTGARTE